MRRKILVIAAISAVCVNNAWGSDDDIMFDRKHVTDLGDSAGAIAVSGTLTGDGLGYKNNTYSIFCIKDRKECLVAVD